VTQPFSMDDTLVRQPRRGVYAASGLGHRIPRLPGAEGKLRRGTASGEPADTTRVGMRRDETGSSLPPYALVGAVVEVSGVLVAGGVHLFVRVGGLAVTSRAACARDSDDALRVSWPSRIAWLFRWSLLARRSARRACPWGRGPPRRADGVRVDDDVGGALFACARSMVTSPSRAKAVSSLSTSQVGPACPYGTNHPSKIGSRPKSHRRRSLIGIPLRGLIHGVRSLGSRIPLIESING